MITPRMLRWSALGILAVALGLNVAAVQVRPSLSGVGFLDAVATLPLTLLGALLVWKKPVHPIGWLMLLLGTAAGMTGLSGSLLDELGPGEAGAGLAQLFNHVGFAMLVGLFGLLLVLFPTGEVVSPRWRILKWLPLITTIFVSASGVFGTPDDSLEARSPFAMPGAGPLFELLGAIGLVCGFISIVCGGISVISRARSGDATVRAQIKWFALAVGTLMVFLLISLTPLFRGPDATRVFDVLLVLITGVVLPVCVAVAILKHRLYDIDLLVNKTLVYGGLTAVLALSYLSAVVALQRVLAPVTVDSDLAVAGSTLLVAALFRPLRSWLQNFIDRRFYRRRYDAVATLEEFSAHLRDEIDLRTLNAELVAVVQATMQPVHATVWLRPTEVGPR